jgi:hypothetical protein
MDLGSNFDSHQFWDFCERSAIEVRYVSVAHPRANGQVERANGYSIYWFMTGTTSSLLQGPRPHNSSSAQIMSFRLVFYVIEGASLPYSQYYSIY